MIRWTWVNFAIFGHFFHLLFWPRKGLIFMLSTFCVGLKKISIKQLFNLNQKSWINGLKQWKKNIDFRNVPLGHFASDCENGILPIWHFWPAIKEKTKPPIINMLSVLTIWWNSGWGGVWGGWGGGGWGGGGGGGGGVGGVWGVWGGGQKWKFLHLAKWQNAGSNFRPENRNKSLNFFLRFSKIKCHYTPAQRSWRGGILDSPCPSVCPSVRLSVDDMVSGA